jgi:hypothetical protein
MYALLAGSSNLGQGLAQYSGAVLLQAFGCQPKGAIDEGEQFKHLWMASLIGIILPLGTLFLIPFLIPDASQTERLLVANPESATAGSYYERKCAKRKGVIRRQYEKVVRDQPVSTSTD